jgi:hypothetical protein
MKLFFTAIFAAFLLPMFPAAQGLHDQKWVLGYDSRYTPLGTPTNGQGGTLIDFGQDPPQQSYFPIRAALTMTNAQICDQEGSLALYSDGCNIYKFPNGILQNGDTINPGFLWDAQCSQEYPSYKGFQTTLSLPWPGRADKYLLLHCGIDTTSNKEFGRYLYVKTLYQTTIEMSPGNSDGAVPKKNEVIVEDTLCQDLSAVRHANGRDWWIVLPRQSSNVFFILLFDPWGLRLVREQAIGIANLGGELSLFSPDGTMYARASGWTGIDLFHFDRCAGSFTDHRRLPYPGVLPDEIYGSPCFSPSSRYLYITSSLSLNQYDLLAADIEASRVQIAQIYNPDHLFLWGTYFDQQLAPNGKIYISSGNGYRYFHVINQPDSAGLACDFVDSGLPLITHSGFTLPNHPNYKLLDVCCSPCDSLGIDSQGETGPGAGKLWVYPNPVMDFAKVALPPDCLRAERVSVHTVSGQFLQDLPVVQVDRVLELDFRDLPAGMYFVSMMSAESKRPWVVKVVKVQR